MGLADIKKFGNLVSKAAEGRINGIIMQANQPANNFSILDLASTIGEAAKGYSAATNGTKVAGRRMKRSQFKNGGSKGQTVNGTRVTNSQVDKMDNWDVAKGLFKNRNGNYDVLSPGTVGIAGSYMGISAAGRIATGGGLYRDSDGNFDIIGVPFF